MCVGSLSCPACKAHAPLCAITCGLSRFTLFFPHHVSNGRIFLGGGGGDLPNPKYVLIFSTCFDWNIILRRSERDMITVYICLRVECPSFFVRFDENWIFLEIFLERNSISDFVKIRPVGSELFHAGKLANTLIREVKVGLRNFENASKNACLKASKCCCPVQLLSHWTGFEPNFSTNVTLLQDALTLRYFALST